MTVQDFFLLLGGLGTIATVIGVALSLYAKIRTLLDDKFRVIYKTFDEKHDELHKRINDVKEAYVRRDDLNGHLQRLTREIQSMHTEQKRDTEKTGERFDRLAARLDNLPKALSDLIAEFRKSG